MPYRVSCLSRLSSNYKKSDTKVSATIKKKTNQVPSSSTIVSVAEAVSVSASVSIAADSDSDLSQKHTQNFGHTDRQTVSQFAHPLDKCCTSAKTTHETGKVSKVWRKRNKKHSDLFDS